MRRIWVLLSLALAIGCTTTPNPFSGAISCQPYGYTPAPVAFSFPPGPVTSAAAEQTAVALIRTCQDDGATILDLTSSPESATGQPSGPNGGQPVWRVRVDATIRDPSGAGYQSHWWIEVNQATGIPTLVAYG